MIPKTWGIPSEYNKYIFIGETGKQLDTSNAPIEWYTKDSCGELEPFDMTPFTYSMEVYDADCLVLTITDIVIKESYKMCVIVPSLDLDFGDYQFKINMIGYNSIASGKLTVRQ